MSRAVTRAFSMASVVVFAALAVAAGLRPAQAFPDRPIHLLVPYPPGGPNDVVARLVADKLSTKCGQQVIVENRPGGSGNTAVVATARAAPDGYTLVLPAMA